MNNSISNDWIEYTLDELLIPISRKTIVADDHVYKLLGVRWYNEGAHIHNIIEGNNISTKELSRVAENDILYNKMWIKKSAFAVAKTEHDGTFCTNEYPQFRANQELLDPTFFEYYFDDKRFQYNAIRYCRGTTSRARLNPNDFLKLKVIIPSTGIQQKIAQILNTWDEAITKTEELIVTLEQRKKGLMQRLLTGQDRFPGFEGEWKEEPLGKQILLETGSRPKGGASSKSEGIPSLGGENITSHGTLELSNVRKISLDYYLPMNKGKLVRGDILINKDGANTGKVGFYREKYFPHAAINEHVFIIRSERDALSQEYLFYYLLSSYAQNEISKRITGSAQPGITSTFAKNISFRFPCVDEQNKISGVLQSCDNEILLYTQKLEYLQKQKKGLMQRLLTGRMRVSF